MGTGCVQSLSTYNAHYIELFPNYSPTVQRHLIQFFFSPQHLLLYIFLKLQLRDASTIRKRVVQDPGFHPYGLHSLPNNVTLNLFRVPFFIKFSCNLLSLWCYSSSHIALSGFQYFLVFPLFQQLLGPVGQFKFQIIMFQKISHTFGFGVADPPGVSPDFDSL